jgi:hypothetical protein
MCVTGDCPSYFGRGIQKPCITGNLLQCLLQLLGTGIDLTDVFSADTAIRKEIVAVFRDVIVKINHGAVELGVVAGNSATLM